MRTYQYNEGQLVEQPAIGLFAKLVQADASIVQNLPRACNPLRRHLLVGQVEISIQTA